MIFKSLSEGRNKSVRH